MGKIELPLVTKGMVAPFVLSSSSFVGGEGTPKAKKQFGGGGPLF